LGYKNNMKDFNKLTNVSVSYHKTPSNSNLPLVESNQKKQIPQQAPPLPTVAQMAKNLASSIVDNVKHKISGGTLKSTSETITSRFKVCMSCEFYNQSKDRCTKCGCKMKVKTGLSASKCPIGKW
jgi:uncharacterized paraquat-inducible protein A